MQGVRQAGLDVDFRVTGLPTPLPQGVELAVYRIVQEALTNTLKHAGLGATSTVEVCWGDGVVTALVTDGGSCDRRAVVTPGIGQGLVGMRERATMYHGEFHVGPRPAGGFEVAVTFPIAAATR